MSWYSVWDDDIQDYYVRCTLRTDIIKPNGKRKYIMFYLHRYIMDAQERDYVDHINHKSLDNTKENLKVTTDQGNIVNRKGANKNNKTTGVRNVSYIKNDNVYRVQIMKNRQRYIWDFSIYQFKEACEFAEKKRKELFAEFSR